MKHKSALNEPSKANSYAVFADVEIKSAYCFGNCALGPSAMVDGELVGRANLEKVTA